MKPKSALFISVVLTVFVLVILGSIVSTINSVSKNEVAAVASATEEAFPTDLSPIQVNATATVPAPIGPEQAASLAAEYMNKTDVYSVESTVLNGVNAFKVVFSSGDVVYIGLDGVVISTETLKPTIVYVEPPLTPQKRHNGGGSGNGNGNGGGGGHEQEDEHDD